jgi:putative DNA primase/helicase
MTEAQLRWQAFKFLMSNKNKGKEKDGQYNPLPTNVTAMLDPLRGILELDDGYEPPLMWNSETEDWQATTEIFAFRNGLVDMKTGQFMAHTPKLWIHHGVGYDWDPAAVCPRWEQFLEEVHPGDKEAQDGIEEGMGLSMTENMEFEKAFLLKGESRSGKGTITHVLNKLVGDQAYVGLSVHDIIGGVNAKENMIGKKVGAFEDTRLKEPKGVWP